MTLAIEKVEFIPFFLSQIRLVYGFVYIQNFKTLDELIMFDDSLVESEKDIAVLLRIKLDPITESEIYVIESFFKK